MHSNLRIKALICLLLLGLIVLWPRHENRPNQTDINQVESAQAYSLEQAQLIFDNLQYAHIQELK